MYKRITYTIAAMGCAAVIATGCAESKTASPLKPAAATPAAAPAKPAVAPAKPKPAATAPAVTVSQANAIGQARDYLNTEAFSRNGLIAQLDSPYGGQFSVADATYAVDSLNVDWNAQAVKAAKQYLATESFSHAGLVDQLSSPYGGQFTAAQAEYGTTGAGL